MFQLFQKMNKQNQTTESLAPELKVAEKLNYHNYTKWCKFMHISIDARGWLEHINSKTPDSTDPKYEQWKQRDMVVLSWIITNIEPDLVNQFLDYSTAWALWRGIETLLGSGRDELQIFDLSSKAASSLKQNNDSIEIYFGKLNKLWKEIDRRMPNPMKYDEDITIFNTFIQTQRLYQFSAGINDTFDNERRDFLNQTQLPTLDMAYATSRQEIARRGIMIHVSSLGKNPLEIGSGLAVHRSEKSSLWREDRTNLRCSHYGGSRHTKDGCFKLIGYLDWSDDLQKRKAAINTSASRIGGKALLMAAKPTGNKDHIQKRT